VGPDKRLPPDGDILMSFDRMLLPASIVRQSFLVVPEGSNAALTPTVKYDPVTRLVTLANPNRDGSSWLRPEQAYKIIFSIPDGESDAVGGLRAIDRATFDPATPPAPIGFLTTATPAGVRSDPPEMQFCSDVLPLFERHCSAPQCHGSPVSGSIARTAAGLLLSTPIGITSTAIGHVANASNTGALAGNANAGRVFGVDMPIIAPGNAGSSFLLYKLIIAPSPPGGWTGEGQTPSLRLKCDGSNGTPPHDPFEPPIPFMYLPDDERDRLSDLVTGNVMPYPPQPGSTNTKENLSVAEMLRLSAWIQQGAKVEDCGACEP
jgi:hypothetical protein